MRTILSILLITYSLHGLRAQTNEYDDIAASFILDSVTVYAVGEGGLNPTDFIRYTMEDTSLFYGFALLKTLSHEMKMSAEVSDQKKREGSIKRAYQQEVCSGCRKQKYVTLDSLGYFFDKKGKPISETYQMLLQFFTTEKRECNIQPPSSPKGLVVLDKPKDIRQQKELIKRFIFAPHTLRIQVPFFGNKMKTNIFEPPTADMYKFKVDFDMMNDSTPVYYFDIEVDSIKYPNWRKSVLIKKMKTTFRVEDLAILQRSYELYYPGWMASCDLSIDIHMQKYKNLLVPRKIDYQGVWKFPTKGKDKAKVSLLFNQIREDICTP